MQREAGEKGSAVGGSLPSYTLQSSPSFHPDLDLFSSKLVDLFYFLSSPENEEDDSSDFEVLLWLLEESMHLQFLLGKMGGVRGC